MTESKKSANPKLMGASGNAPTRITIGVASNNAPMKESLNAPVRQFNGSQDAPNLSSRGKQVSYKVTANDSQ